MKKILLPHQLYYTNFDMQNVATRQARERFINSLDEGGESPSMIYLHIPFCDYICSFCPFDKDTKKSGIEKYVASIKREIDFYADTTLVRSLEFTGIHFGGGTPTSLHPKYIGELIDYVRKELDACDVPLHVEGSATTLTDRTIELLKEKGVSRTSFGVQSFNTDLRRRLSIGATLDDVFSTISRLKDHEMGVHIDLMYGFPDFGIPGQGDIAIADIEKAIELGVDSLELSQFYQLHSPLQMRIYKEGMAFPSGEQIVRIISTATRLLESAGFVQTSEYAFHRRGNVMLERSYFGDSTDTLALGPSSIGRLHGYSYRNMRHRDYNLGEVPQLALVKKLTKEELDDWDVVSFPRVLILSKRKVTEKYKNKFETLVQQGLAEETDEAFILTSKGKCYISNIHFFLMDEEQRKSLESGVLEFE